MLDEQAIQDLRSSLDADGYRLEINEEGDRVNVAVVATPEACADCLVPRALFLGILEGSLGVSEHSIDLTYPNEAEAN